MLKRLLSPIALCVAFLAQQSPGAGLGIGEENGPQKAEYTLHSGHFVKNTSGLKGEASFLLIPNQEQFDSVFGSAFTMGKKPKVVPKGAFEKKIVVAVIHRGNAIWKYQVEKVATEGETLTIRYKATKGKAGTATFASPLIVSVNKGKIKKVVFIENGKAAGKAELPD